MAAISAIFILRFIMETSTSTWENNYGSYIGSAANAVQIQIMNFLYGKLATRLTENENYRTKTEHEDSLISKVSGAGRALSLLWCVVQGEYGHCPRLLPPSFDDSVSLLLSC